MDTSGLSLRSGHSRRRSTHPRLLIIDDDSALLESLAGMLTIRLGRVHVETCSHPGFARSMVRRDGYEIILCDVSMPDIDGLALLPALRDSAPDAAIVMMSAVANPDVQKNALLNGATAFVTKPFDREMLTVTLQHLLEDITHVSGAVLNN
jgi:DNA-binding NtrC family response regulator